MPRTFLLIAVGGIVSTCALLGARDLRSVRTAALRGSNRLAEVQTQWGDKRAVRDTIESAGRDFQLAAKKARSPWLTAWRAVPIVRRQVETVRALADSGRASTLIALSVYDELETSHQPGAPDSARPARLARLSASLRQGAAALTALPAGSESLLLAPLSRARQRFLDERRQAVDGMTKASVVVDGLREMFAGPSHYVVLAGNNAEMKVGMGTALFIGDLTVADGSFRLGRIQKPAQPVDTTAFADPDLERNWGWLYPNRDIRLTGLTPRFDVGGRQAARIWSRQTGTGYNGAIAFDVEFIRTLLTSTGPVTVNGRVIDASNVVRFLTYDQYFLPDRNEVNVLLAREVFTRMTSGVGSQDLSTVKAILSAVQGRHLMLWSAGPIQQRAWETAGAAGKLAENSLMVGMVNRNDKLDPYLDVTADVRVEGRYRNRIDLALQLSVKNNATGLEDEQINGMVNKLPALSPSEYRSFVSVSVPRAATLLRFEGVDKYVVLGPDGPTKVAAVSDYVLPGATKTYVVRFSLPADYSTLRIEPSARIPGISWSYRGEVLSDDRPNNIDLSTLAPERSIGGR